MEETVVKEPKDFKRIGNIILTFKRFSRKCDPNRNYETVTFYTNKYKMRSIRIILN